MVAAAVSGDSVTSPKSPPGYAVMSWALEEREFVLSSQHLPYAFIHKQFIA